MTRAIPLKVPVALSMTVVAVVLSVFVSTPAQAVYQCGDTKDTCICGLDNPFPCCNNGGNCTWYAFHSACCGWGVAVPMRGNAKTWAGVARSDPNYQVISYPVVKSIGCTETTAYGHVAWVTAVNGSSITIHEQNCWGNYGVRIRNTNQSEFNAYIIRAGQLCECKAGETQTHSCGDCGIQVRSCGSDCKWAAWSACQATEIPADACDTGLAGVCSKGAILCVDGNKKCNQTVQPSKEVCDQIDNNCDGYVDEGNVCASSGIDSGAGDSALDFSDSGLPDSSYDSMPDLLSEVGTDSNFGSKRGSNHGDADSDSAGGNLLWYDSNIDGSGCACSMPGKPLRGSWGVLLVWFVGAISLCRCFRLRRA